MFKKMELSVQSWERRKKNESEMYWKRGKKVKEISKLFEDVMTSEK